MFAQALTGLMLDQWGNNLPAGMSVEPQSGRETSDSTIQVEAAGIIEEKAFNTKHRVTCGIGSQTKFREQNQTVSTQGHTSNLLTWKTVRTPDSLLCYRG